MSVEKYEMPPASRARPIVAVIQARMTSTRLPLKVMRDVCGHPVLWHVVNRLKASRLIDEIAVATSAEASDDVIEKWCAEMRVKCSRGSLDDVLDRFYRAAKGLGARTVVRITADCPLIDPVLVDYVIEVFLRGDFDYVKTGTTFPDGLDVEVMGISVLERAWRDATLSSEREHVTPYIWKNPGIFKVSTVENRADLSDMRWTVDDERDLEFVRAVYEGFEHGRLFGTGEILELLEARPELLSINSGAVRNEGYARSLKKDSVADAV